MFRRDSSKSLLKNSKSFKFDDYIFHFNNAIKVPQIVELMEKYLKKEYNSEPLEFLDRLSEFKKKIAELYLKYNDQVVGDHITLEVFEILHKEFAKQAQQIIDTFLANQSPKEINIAGATKKAVIEQLSKICTEANTILSEKEEPLLSPSSSLLRMSRHTRQASSVVDMSEAAKETATAPTITAKHVIRCSVLHQRHYQLFTSLETAIKGQLQFDVFPRFIRSDLWKDFVMKQDKQFLEQISTRRQQNDIVKSLYTYDDYTAPVITDLDFDLIRQLAQDGPEWKLIYTHNKSAGNVELTSSCYIMLDYNFIVGEGLPAIYKNRPFTKIECYFPYDANECYETLKSLEHCYKAEKILEKVSHVNYLPPGDGRKYATGYELFKYKLGNPKLINYRLFNLHFSDIIDFKDTSCIIGFARDCSYNQDLPKRHTLGSIYAAYIFKQMGQKLTRFTQLTSMNMSGAMKGFDNAIYRKFLKNMFITRCKNLRDDLMNGLQEREANNWKPLDEASLLRIRDLKENTIYHSALYNKDDNLYSLVNYAMNIPVETESKVDDVSINEV